MDEPDASRQHQQQRNGPAADARMHGVFTDAETGRLTYALSLSDSCLTVQRINSPSSPPASSEHLDLRDCLGSRAHRGEREDQSAYLCAYFYPYRRRWMASGPVRQRDERRFQLELNSDDNNDEEEDANLREAERNTVCEEMLRGHEVSHLGHVHLHLSNSEGADGGLTL
ncbi:hypothetical protein DPX16_1691 [Anabarilius grahami]|uniref:Uncharacterized protein n=1 Tax=Anabarilius grahami TaxID=495550 RepID=A0A3N0XJB8_ANAGA|nr:hypothetical protein DPX16_1691 [Anabarilius grahami]